MKTTSWENVLNFQTSGEFNRFVDWLQDQRDAGLAQEVPVLNVYVGATTFQEKWFINRATGQTWRLVWPDPPFTGIFELVEDADPHVL